jgi:hypothetical protein
MTKDEPGTKDLCSIGREQIIRHFLGIVYQFVATILSGKDSGTFR